ncbi:MAG: DNA-3-methyladenine glycosylase [Thermoleophilia bacterium]|nr:DNA-3-methyladenine glycosylase [Thermoleophilia bacterium]
MTAARAPKPRRVPAADTDVSALPPAPRRPDGLTYDRAAALRHLRKVSPDMKALIKDAGPFTVEPDGDLDPFAYLLRSIVFQQLNGVAAGTIHGRVLDLFEGGVATPAELVELDADTLRTAGVSGSKAASMHDLARHALAGELPTHDELPTMSDLEIVHRLTAVRGIGPWTVQMLLMFRLGRPDVLPTGDFGVREGFRIRAGLDRQPTPTEFRAATESWRPYRSVASWYMWRAVDLARGTVIPR